MREINEKLMNTAKLLVANNFFGTIRIRTFPLERKRSFWNMDYVFTNSQWIEIPISMEQTRKKSELKFLS